MLFILNIIISFLMISMFEGSSLEKPSSMDDYTGETMHYTLKYGIFNIGLATISCLEDKEGCGHIIKAEAQSTGLLKIFKDLNYRFECCMDPATGLPISATMDLKDGKNYAYDKVLFDHYSRADSSIIISEDTSELVVPKDIHDLLTGYYLFRSNYFAESIIHAQPVVIQTYLADMLWDLKMTYMGGEIINTIYGDLSCLRFTSSTVVGRFFKNDDDMTVWFTKEEIPVPVRIRLNLKIGSIKGELYEYQMPANYSSKLNTGEK